MAFFRSTSSVVGRLLSLLLLLPSSTTRYINPADNNPLPFREAPEFRNGQTCPFSSTNTSATIHVAMALDANYLRGTMAAVLSILQHSTCPENIAFHFVWTQHEPQVLDSDLVMVDDIAKLWGVDMNKKALAAPEYCHANFTNYFTDEFWSDPELSTAFDGRKPCYFNTGVMVMDLEKWRNGNYTQKVESWMVVQKNKRIYHLGSLPPFLLVLAGNIEPVDHRWNQHGPRKSPSFDVEDSRNQFLV